MTVLAVVLQVVLAIAKAGLVATFLVAITATVQLAADLRRPPARHARGPRHALGRS
ncbi:MAG: hypothetical protein HOV79_00350 [Hamadaea sp.]|nr:hypothetical protein [Hamadaea sp.]